MGCCLQCDLGVDKLEIKYGAMRWPACKVTTCDTLRSIAFLMCKLCTYNRPLPLMGCCLLHALGVDKLETRSSDTRLP